MKTFSEVRALVGGVKGVMQKVGDAPADGRWNPMTYCPFCKAKNTAGVFNQGGVDCFKCHQLPGRKHQGCPTNGDVLTEVSYLAMREGLSEEKPTEGGPSPAYRRLLELAGCWEAPSAPAVKKAKKGAPLPPAEPLPAPAPPPAAEAPVRPNPVLPPSSPAVPPSADEEKGDDADMILKCIEVIRMESKASVSLLQRRLKIGYSRATRIMEVLEQRKIVGPSKGAEPRDILRLPDERGYIVIKLDEELHFEKADGRLIAATVAAPAPPAAPKPADKGEDKNKLPLGMAALRGFFNRLQPTREQMQPYFDPAVYFCEKCWRLETGESCQNCGRKLAPLTGLPELIPQALAKQIKFKPLSLFSKRALTALSCDVLGLRANNSGNEAILREICELYPWEEVRASGLWLEASRKAKLGRRPNAQFCGKGQIGKKPERERRTKDDKWVWGWCDPVLIPFFDEAGELLKLRPHKGGAPTGTVAGRPRIYVPRDYRKCADMVEKFYEVVICEGEYKAMAIWQTLGLGAKLQVDAAGQPLITEPNFEPIGVCALPGISYVTNPEMRMDLERWLVDVGARRVIVAFDDEDKSDKPMRQRFDAQRDARVLAIELSKQLHIDTRVCVLPPEWRNARGKADWDGALVKLTAEAPALTPATGGDDFDDL